MKCSTCGKETTEVKRVVIDAGYDRTLAKALYNCPECYDKKLKARSSEKPAKE
jgi:DNA-directed RNA polymerase subunit RPC12/RpoP